MLDGDDEEVQCVILEEHNTASCGAGRVAKGKEKGFPDTDWLIDGFMVIGFIYEASLASCTV